VHSEVNTNLATSDAPFYALSNYVMEAIEPNMANLKVHEKQQNWESAYVGGSRPYNQQVAVVLSTCPPYKKRVTTSRLCVIAEFAPYRVRDGQGNHTTKNKTS